MLVVGLHGWILPAPAILFCDLFVYSEFLIHPLLLLLASKRLRKEIMKGCKGRILVSFPSHIYQALHRFSSRSFLVGFYYQFDFPESDQNIGGNYIFIKKKIIESEKKENCGEF